MLDFIERLRQKPAALRAPIVFVSASAITGIIFFIWLSVISVQFRSTTPFEAEGQEENGNNTTSFADIQEDISALFDLGKIELQELQTELSADIPSETESVTSFSDQELEFIEEGKEEEEH